MTPPDPPPSEAAGAEPAVRVARSRPLRLAYAALGWLCVAFGAVGVVLPGWPTTVWLLVAAFFFSRSSPRFYAWLLRHRLFGPLIRDVREGRGIPRGTKIFAVSMIVLFAGTSGVLLWSRPWLSLLVFAVAAVGVAVVLRQPTRLADPAAPAASPVPVRARAAADQSKTTSSSSAGPLR